MTDRGVNLLDFDEGDVLRIGSSVYEVETIDPRPSGRGSVYKLVRHNDGELFGETAARLEPHHRDEAFKWTLIEVTGVTEDEVEVVE